MNGQQLVQEFTDRERGIIKSYLSMFKDKRMNVKDDAQAFEFLRERRQTDALYEFLKNPKLRGLGFNYGGGFLKTCLVTAKNPEDGSIFDIGGSTPLNLILTNFGQWLAAFIREGTGLHSITMQPIGGGDQGTDIYTDVVTDMFNDSRSETFIRLGSGTTAPARADIAIETALPTAPEDANFGSGDATWSAAGGTISWGSSVAAGGAGTIAEVGFLVTWSNDANSMQIYLLFRDTPSALGFVAGKVLGANYQLTL